jgi:hypothetical protein
MSKIIKKEYDIVRLIKCGRIFRRFYRVQQQYSEEDFSSKKEAIKKFNELSRQGYPKSVVFCKTCERVAEKKFQVIINGFYFCFKHFKKAVKSFKKENRRKEMKTGEGWTDEDQIAGLDKIINEEKAMRKYKIRYECKWCANIFKEWTWECPKCHLGNTLKKTTLKEYKKGLIKLR